MTIRSIEPTAAEVVAMLPGDDLVPRADVVMDRAFTLAAEPTAVWPWLVQLGKHRAGWYLPLSVERGIPRRRRALRRIDPALQNLSVGATIPDWGGADATFTAVIVDPVTALVYRSTRGRTHLSWAIVLSPAGARTRVHFRLRLAPVRHRRLANTVGGFIDWLTIAGLAAGLRERVAPAGDSGP
jgi:hypothetical protein